jgi:hypothetical protein
VLQVAALLEDPEEAPEVGLGQELGELAFLPGFAQAQLPPGLLTDIEEVGVVEAYLASQAHDLADDVRYRLLARFCEMIDCRALSSNRSVEKRRRIPGVPPQIGGCGVKHDWNADELLENWTLLLGEKQLLANKSGATYKALAELGKVLKTTFLCRY